MATEIASFFAKVGADVSDFSRGMEKVKTDLSFAEKGMTGLQNVVGTGLKMAAGVGVAAIGGLAAGMTKAVSAAADVEQQAANIGAVFGDMAPPIDTVKGLINTLALDPNLVVGVADAGAGIQMLAQNGLTWQQIADGAARSSILLSNATGADLATSADIATNAMGIFGLEVKDLDSVVATFVNSANKSQFGVEDWGYALSNAGPKAASFGWELDQLFAAMTLTSSGFSSGMTMGTSWAWMINGLVPNTEKAAGLMRELGLITEDGANAFFNADGTGKELTEVIKLLQGAFGGLTVEQQMAYSRTIFGQEAFGALSAVLQLNNDELATLIPQMTDFSAVEAGAETRTATFSAAMAALSDTVNSVFVMIGDKLLPVTTDMARAFADFIKDNAPAVVEWFGTFATRIETAVGWLSEAVATGTLFNSKFGEMPPLVQTVVTGINDLIAGFTAFLAPIVKAVDYLFDWQDVLNAVAVVIASIVVPAIAGFIAAAAPVIALFAALVAASAVLRAAWTGDWDGINKFVAESLPAFARKMMEWGEAAWKWISDAIPVALAKLTEWGGALWDWLKINLSKWAKKLGEWGEAAWKWIEDAAPIALRLLGDWSTALINWLARALPDFLRMIFEWGTALYKWIGDAIPNAINSLADFIHGIRTKGEGEGTPAFIKMAGEWATKLWRWIVDDLIPAVGPAFSSFIQAMGTYGLELLKALANLATELGLLLWEWIVDVTPTALQKLGEWGAALWEWITDNMPSWVAKLSKWATAAWEWIVDVTPVVLQKLGEWGARLWGWIVDNAPTWANKLGQWAKAAWEWIVDVTPVVLQKLKDLGVSLINWIVDNAPTWAAKFLSAGRDIVKGLWDGLKEKWSDLTEWFGGVWGSLVDRFKNFFGIHSPSTLFAGFGNDLMQGLSNGISNGANLVKTILDGLGVDMSNKMTGMVNGVQSVANSITAIVNSIPMPTIPTVPAPTTTPTAPTTTTPTIPPPQQDDRGPTQTQNGSYGDRNIALALNAFSSYLDISDTFKDISDFATQAKSLLINVPSSSEAGMAINSLTSAGVDSLSVDRLLSAIQVLVRKIEDQGLGAKFNITAAPDSALAQNTELEELVTYLNALYG